jgi:drug/metabolite transporter (DMT)-like permease
MKYLRFAPLFALLASGSLFGQSASLKADNATLAASGGNVLLTATVNYDGEPGALGYAIALPADWSFVSVMGPNVPAITPEAGSTGMLEFAFTSVPANRAEFSVLVHYPASAASAKATPTVLVRSAGKLSTLKPAPVELHGVDVGALRRSHD